MARPYDGGTTTASGGGRRLGRGARARQSHGRIVRSRDVRQRHGRPHRRGGQLGGGFPTLVACPTGAVASPTVRRWSTIALWCFCAVALSGVVAATTRLGTWSDLTAPYGILVVVKAIALLTLGVAGWLHRRWSINGSRSRAADSGACTRRGRRHGRDDRRRDRAGPQRPTGPGGSPDPTPALALTGFPAPLPPPRGHGWSRGGPTGSSSPLPPVAIGTYAAGLSASDAPTARGRLDGPQPGGGLARLRGCHLGGAGTYGRVALSWHLALVLVGLLIVPVLLVIGDPVGLVVKASDPRRTGRSGSTRRRWPSTASSNGRPGSPSSLSESRPWPSSASCSGRASSGRSSPTRAMSSRPWRCPPRLRPRLVDRRGVPGGSAQPRRGGAGHARRGDRPAGPRARARNQPLAADFFGGLRLPWLTDLLAEQHRAGIVICGSAASELLPWWRSWPWSRPGRGAHEGADPAQRHTAWSAVRDGGAP